MNRRDVLRTSGFIGATAIAGCTTSCSCGVKEEKFGITPQPLPQKETDGSTSSKRDNTTTTNETLSSIEKSQIEYPSKTYFSLINGEEFVSENTIKGVEENGETMFDGCVCEYSIEVETKLKEESVSKIDFIRVFHQDDKFISKHSITGSKFTWNPSHTHTYVLVAFERKPSSFEIIGCEQYKLTYTD